MDGTNSDGFAVPMLPVNYARQKMLPSTSSLPVQQTAPVAASSQQAAAAVIRRRRFSTAKIQPTRIKKVMQSDEEIGRMVQSVPVSIGRAMEHFAEKFLQAAADATQFTSSKTLNPQHMKQAVQNNPHFSFLETLFKDVSLPQQSAEMSTARAAMTLKEQQLLQEQQKTDYANAILASARLQMDQGETASTASPGSLPLEMQNAFHPNFLQGISAANFPVVQELAASMPLSPSTPTSQLVTGMLEMLGKKTVGQQRLNGFKRSSTDGNDEDRPKRGRPRKLKTEKCVDEALFEEATRNIVKEDKDREMMPPPALPIGRP